MGRGRQMGWHGLRVADGMGRAAGRARLIGSRCLASANGDGLELDAAPPGRAAHAGCMHGEASPSSPTLGCADGGAQSGRTGRPRAA
eukprot:6418342-Prymnesium_polylepis.1